jgi:F-type H+-transporting ATPase subunit epsilon
MQVELVAADRLVWSGEARMVIARTTEGDVGILPNHAPMLSTMVEGIVDVTTADNETWIAAVDAGFLSVANNRISVLAEHAEMSHDIDLEKARADLERCHQEGAGDDEALAKAEAAWAEARIRAAERAS